MSPCCNTPHIARLEKIKENRFDFKEMSTESPGSAGELFSKQEIIPPGNYMNGTDNTSFPPLPRHEMTAVVYPAAPVPGTPTLTPGVGSLPEIPGNQTDELFPGSPSFQVPSNPLLPPGYNEVLDYDALQYLNGFYRTQIGRYVRIEQQINSDDIEIRYGYLIGVGINYLLLQDASTGNVYAIDSYSIKLFYVYYNIEGPFGQLPGNPR